MLSELYCPLTAGCEIPQTQISQMSLPNNVFYSWMSTSIPCKCYMLLKIKVDFNKTFVTFKDSNIIKIIPLPFYQL